MRLSISNGLSISGQQTGSAGGGGGAAAVSFGALTLAGAGGVAKPAGATAISDAGGTNLVLSSGFAVPDTGGTVTSGTVVWDDGTEWTVTAVANTYSAKCDKTEIEAAFAAASTSATTTCLVREGSTTDTIVLTGKTFTGGFTLKGSGFATNSATRPSGYTWGSRVGAVQWNGAKISLEEIRIGKDFASGIGAYINHVTGAGLANCNVKKCEVFGTPLATWIEELIAEGGTGSTAIGKIASGYQSNLTAYPCDTVLIEDCYFHDLRGPGALRGDNWTVKGNYGEDMIGGGYGLLPGDNQQVLNNELIGLWAVVDDPGDVHGGLGGGTVQFTDSGYSCTNVVYKGNILMLGNARAAHEASELRSEPNMVGITGVKFNDVAGNAANYDDVEFSHNIVQCASGLGVTFENATNVKCHHNTMIGIRGSTDDLGATNTGQPGVYFEYFDSYSGAAVQCYDNILAPDNGMTATVIADADGWTFYRNESVVNDAQPKSGITEARTYDEYFTGDATKGLGADLTTAEIVAAVTPKAFTRASSQNIGAVNSYYTPGIPGKDGSDTTPALSVPSSSGSVDATGHAYSKTVWDGTYGLELDADGRSGAIYDGATTATVANGKAVTLIFQGEFTAGDASEFVLMDSNGQDLRTSRATNATNSNSRFEHVFDWVTDATERAFRASPTGRYNSGTGRFCYAISIDLDNDRICVMRNGTAYELIDRGTEYDIANALINLSQVNVHFFETTLGGSRGTFQLEAFIFENQFIDLHTSSGSIIAQDGFLRAEAAIDTAFGRNPLIFLQGNAAAFNAGNGNTLGRAQGVTVTNSGTVTDVDTTAPTLSSPTDAADGATASTGSVSTNEGNGTLYWVVTTSATAPSAAQVKAGQDNGGSAAADSGSQSVSGTGVQTLSPAPSGLTASTAYTTHFMHEDAAANQSAVSSASGFTTASGSNVDEGSSTATFTTSGGFRVAELTNGQTLVVSTGFTPTGIEMVGGGGGGGYYGGGGGGAGELIQDNSTPPALTAQTYTATVGAGGTGSDGTLVATNGGNTRLIGGSTDDVALTALGGGAGGSSNASSSYGVGGGYDGGSGGGSGGTGVSTRNGVSTASDGVGTDGGDGAFSPLCGGGGGGSTGAGGNQSGGTGGAGGAGTSSIAPGKSETLAAGGSGGTASGTSAGADATVFGCGGGGGDGSGAGAARNGGDGFAGIIRVWWPV